MGFKSLSISKKLFALCSLLMANMLFVAAINFYYETKLSASFDDVARTQLPAVRNMTLVDMMHDGIRAVVLNAIVSSGDPSKTKEVTDELKEFSTNIEKHLATIAALNVKTETKNAISAAKPDIEAYISSAEMIVALANGSKAEEAISKMPLFDQSFKALEGSLEKLGELIEADSEASYQEGVETIKRANMYGLMAILVGLGFGIFTSVIIVRELTKGLNSASKHLNNQATTLTQLSREIKSVAESLSASATQQASAVQETAASVDEISAMVKKTEDNSNQLTKNVLAGQDSANDGQIAVAEMVEAMNTISRSNEEVIKSVELGNKQIEDIVKVIAEIGEKTKVINDIVFQTKLLSFNASVEAARAGEHGKGFAVVAEEVGNLAQMSGNASKEISQMLSEGTEKANMILTQTRSRVEVMTREGREKIQMGLKVAGRCGDSLNEIVKHVGGVTTMTQEIGVAIKEQASGTNEISKALNLFNQTTNQTSAIAQQTSAISGNIFQQTDELLAVVDGLNQIVLGKNQSLPTAEPTMEEHVDSNEENITHKAA